MASFFSHPRQAETTMPCKACGRPVSAKRSCLRVSLVCPSCKKEYPLEDYLAKMDAALESFLDGVYIDRI